MSIKQQGPPESRDSSTVAASPRSSQRRTRLIAAHGRKKFRHRLRFRGQGRQSDQCVPFTDRPRNQLPAASNRQSHVHGRLPHQGPAWLRYKPTDCRSAPAAQTPPQPGVQFCQDNLHRTPILLSNQTVDLPSQGISFFQQQQGSAPCGVPQPTGEPSIPAACDVQLHCRKPGFRPRRHGVRKKDRPPCSPCLHGGISCLAASERGPLRPLP